MFFGGLFIMIGLWLLARALDRFTRVFAVLGHNGLLK